MATTYQAFTWWYRQATKNPVHDSFVTVKSTVSLPPDEQHADTCRAAGRTAPRSDPASTAVAFARLDPVSDAPPPGLLKRLPASMPSRCVCETMAPVLSR